MNTTRKPGRPGGESADKKALILRAAKQHFEAAGFERTTIRAICRTAGVDPKLVFHYFKDKRELFFSTVRPSRNPQLAMNVLRHTPRDKWGINLAKAIARSRNTESTRTQVAILRVASTEPEGGEYLANEMLIPTISKLVSTLELDNPEIRGRMLATTILGVLTAEHIVPIREASMQAADVAMLGKVLQEILTGDL